MTISFYIDVRTFRERLRNSELYTHTYTNIPNVSKFPRHCRNLNIEQSHKRTPLSMYYYHRGLWRVSRNINSRDSWTLNKKQYIENTRGSSVNPPSGFIGAASHKLQLLSSSWSSREAISSSSTSFVPVRNFYNQFLRFFILEKVLREFHSRGWILWFNSNMKYLNEMWSRQYEKLNDAFTVE